MSSYRTFYSRNKIASCTYARWSSLFGLVMRSNVLPCCGSRVYAVMLLYFNGVDFRQSFTLVSVYNSVYHKNQSKRIVYFTPDSLPFTLRRPNLVGPPFACPNIQARTHNPALITFPFRVRGSARAPVSNTTPYPREARTARSSSRSHHDLISARASVEYQLVERVWVTATRTLRAAGTWVDRNHRLCLDHAHKDDGHARGDDCHADDCHEESS